LKPDILGTMEEGGEGHKWSRRSRIYVISGGSGKSNAASDMYSIIIYKCVTLRRPDAMVSTP
jgi:hypothetical protein